MTTDLAAPVKKLTQTWSRGAKLAKKFGKAASAEHDGDVEELRKEVESLQQALEGDSKDVEAEYRKCEEAHQDSFAKSLEEDSVIYSKLQDLRMDLIDLINQIQDFEPDDFEIETFNNVKTDSRRIHDRCIEVFQLAGESRYNQGWSFATQQNHERPSDRLSRSGSGSTQASYSTTTTKLRAVAEDELGVSPRTQGNWLSNDSLGTREKAKGKETEHEPTVAEQVTDQSSGIEIDPSRLIPTAEVDVVVKANDDFLERRRMSKLLFYQNTRLSVVSIDENSESNFDVVSPISPLSPELRPKESRSRSSSDYTAFVNDKRSSGHTLEIKRKSVASSVHTTGTSPGEARASSSKTRNDDLFGSASPGSDSGSTKDLAATLRLPGYGKGVEQGLEPVNAPPLIDHSNEKIPVPTHHPQHRTPTSSVKSVDSPMRHDSSFYKFGGFCEGAKASLRGELGYKISNRPTGTWGTEDYGKCIKCSYEISLTQIENDARMEIAGIYGSHRIRWRQQFLTKCHVRTSAAEEPMYACLFCIEDRKTPEEHDATIFFSPSQLFRHLARHQRPFSKVNGLIVLYGKIPLDTTNFDLHVMQEAATQAKYNATEIAPEVAVRPAGNAVITYNPGRPRNDAKDAESIPKLHFAAGARILGITFPEHLAGAWCVGYHDGEKGMFPSASVSLEPPNSQDVFMSPQSSLIAFARWSFAPKEGKEGWLKFSRGDRIINIGYTFQDQWCWSGQTKNGKWGLFPACFVEGLQDGGNVIGGGGRKSSGFLGKLRNHGSVSRAVRSPSIRNGSSGKGSSSKSQPGLEVVVNGVSM